MKPSLLLRNPAVIPELIGFPAPFISSLSTSNFPTELTTLLFSFHWENKSSQRKTKHLLSAKSDMPLYCLSSLSPMKMVSVHVSLWNTEHLSLMLIHRLHHLFPVYIIPTKYEYVEIFQPNKPEIILYLWTHFLLPFAARFLKEPFISPLPLLPSSSLDPIKDLSHSLLKLLVIVTVTSVSPNVVLSLSYLIHWQHFWRNFVYLASVPAHLMFLLLHKLFFN